MEWSLLSPEIYGFLFLVAMVAGFIDSIAGGGGLLTIPALLSVGVSPVQALATNKLQAVGGSFSASLYFIRRGAVDWRSQRFAIAMTLFGAMLGALLVQFVSPDFLLYLLPVLVIIIGLYFLLVPNIGAEDRPRRLAPLAFGCLAGGGIGFYDGVFGPGTGSFLALSYVMLCGYNLAKATAHAKVLNFASNMGSLGFFILGGQVLWLLGLVMLMGQVIGARLGAGLVLSRGQKLIRPMLVTISFLMSIKLLHDHHGDTIRSWLAFYF
ncbi:sulfite exporter TauE/SafE family protein [Xenorhabdus bovienii]|uniref:Probable membrane transporter protein n=1 Tax=Xenorhabdus bovienii TaxID=40576 RepID=A0AAJ1J606_XENBV|nr:sulfite exporter TauE/SafE family protein [Xenorhabdus bovienii]MDE1477724.1 sulfite exporter TauE/SafE family protein [Xenorhabdus bovienii]MDE1487577.1 sulfite exporter TauE/SafE family protein [Xenorhabdus bovienii]MDE1489846.1 sulfite exporter TauE/SafE family protein [Xenorhabdus bovienii]MDE1494164.1 sulfite exporter TauE/SafE family protein [Xenorhabdus bovienii]MDE9472353.1 sulfite exporter TauE/SafE family protein [Xenorhabdus bovienii]